jgi:hypothetical protein
MRITDALATMDLLLDKAEQPYYSSEEKIEFLKEALHSFINKHYSEYDKSQVSRDALQAFVKTDTNAQLPNDYLHLISVLNNSKELEIVGIKQYESNVHSGDPFNKNSIATVKNGSIEVNDDSPSLNYTYLSSPKITSIFDTIDLSGSEPSVVKTVPEIYLSEIINLAVRKMMVNTESDSVLVSSAEIEQSRPK